MSRLEGNPIAREDGKIIKGSSIFKPISPKYSNSARK
jgi:hypothetical protein